MECKNCLTKIEDTEIYCEDCKQKFEQENQLNELIDENKELNHLEKTKEIDVLKPLNEEIFVPSNLKEELKEIVKIDEIEKENNLKKTIIIISIIFALIVSIFICFLFFKNNNNKSEEEKINYKSILNEYGNLLKKTAIDHVQTTDEIPSWDIINKKINYKDHKIKCNVHDIYEDGSIYLNECKIDGNNIKYSYGNKKQIIKGKEINIYENVTETNLIIYNDKESDILLGTLTCQSENCELINAYEKYALIKELDKFYLYNYIENNMIFGPFNMSDTENGMLVYENVLYGILYNEDSKQNIYSVKTDKSFSNIKGSLLLDDNLNSRLIYKYGYAIFETDKGNDFVSLNTGNTNYIISQKIKHFIESKDNKIVYIATSNSSNSKEIIYNSNGKKLFDGKEFNSFKIYGDQILVYNDYNFFIYDLNLKLVRTSKDYERIFSCYDDLFIVIDDSNLKIVDTNDNSITNFDFKWDDNYMFDSSLSTFTRIDQDFEISIVINDILKDDNYYLTYNSNTKNIKITKI